MLEQLETHRAWLGMGGVPPHDEARAYLWEKRLHGVMLAAALCAVLAFYLTEFASLAQFVLVGRALEWVVFAAFALELGWMLRLTRQKVRYLMSNWINVLIVLSAGLTLAGAATGWVAWLRLLRFATVGMLLVRMLRSLRPVLRPGGLPYVFGFAALSVLVGGACFYWLDPSVGSYADGLWLAFVTAATVGYGDLVPTTPAARFVAVIIVIIGVAMLSMVTASIAAFFVGEDEKLLRREMHHDIRQLRHEVAQMIGEEERALRREVRDDVRVLREEIRLLRAQLERRHAEDPPGGQQTPEPPQ
jgi:voltage-gated potassium channel